MKWFLLAVLLALPKTAFSSPSQTANSNVNPDAKNVDSVKVPTTPPPAVDPLVTNPSQNVSNAPRADNLEPSISVEKLPPVSVAKDWTDRAYWIFSGLLVLVGGFQAWLLWRTLRAIKRQADIMDAQKEILGESVKVAGANARAAEVNARAAEKNIEILVSKERARLQLQPGIPAIASVYDPVKVNAVRYTVRCYGTTPATILAAQARGQISDSEEWHREESYIALPIPSVLLPTPEEIEGSIPLSFGSELDLDQIDVGDRIRKKELFVHFYGYIKYEDIFGGEWRYSFRYTWTVGLYGVGQWLRSTEGGENIETSSKL